MKLSGTSRCSSLSSTALLLVGLSIVAVSDGAGRRKARRPAGTPLRHPLFLWLEKCGGWASPDLEVAPVTAEGQGRGLFTKRAFKASEVLISLPVNCTITKAVALEESPLLQDRLEALEGRRVVGPAGAVAVPVHKMLIATFVLQRMQSPQMSRFGIYLKDLQSQAEPTIRGIPLFWPQEDGSELFGTFASESLKSELRTATDDFKSLSDMLPEIKSRYGAKEYQLAYSFVRSRVFSLQIPGEEPQPALYPLIDMANHHLAEPRELLDETNGPAYAKDAADTVVEVVNHTDGKFGSHLGYHVQMRSQHGHAQGAQVFYNYGLQSNALYLLKYGFTVPWIHNRTCLASTSLHLPVDDLPERPDAREWRSLLRRAVGEIVTFQVDVCLGKGVEAAVEFARLWSSPSSIEALEEQCGLGSLGERDALQRWRLDLACPLASRGGEEAALDLLSSFAVGRYKPMAGGTLEDDEAILMDPKVKHHKRSAVTVRRDEKFALRRFQQWIEVAQAQLKAVAQEEDWRSYWPGLGNGVGSPEGSAEAGVAQSPPQPRGSKADEL